MKHNYLLLISFLLFSFAQAQIVTIPDVNFKNALVNTNCVDTNDDGTFDADADTNNDGDIQESEAESVVSLDVSSNNILDMTGIEAFTNIEKLELNINQVSTLDFSNNLLLEELSAGTNQLINVDLINNTSLKKIYIGNNQLTELDISNNSQLTDLCIFSNQIINLVLPTSLNDLVLFEVGSNPINFTDLSIFSNVTDFWCDSTLITSLDLSQFTNLEILVCLDNSLTFLDVRNGNNINMTLFDASINPLLECIYVDDAEGAYLADWTKDNESTYVNDEMACGALSVDEVALQTSITIYPNPVVNDLYIKSNQSLESIIVYDINGRRIKTIGLNDSKTETKIDLSTISKGVYFLIIKTAVGEQTSKIIKD